MADERYPNWVVVIKTKPRDMYDTGEEEVTDDDEDEYLVNEYCNTSNNEAIEPAIDDVMWARNDEPIYNIDSDEFEGELEAESIEVQSDVNVEDGVMSKSKME
ncbi:hypothetical protein F2P56_008184 [Juglans regia]|uniref:Uncharacterized protein n=1 Tax=Juglans regia TaxID=51240 RepID=A0A833XVU7_JUGRE|nr:hypothetical protein F2P56_008184 [Juglans regia]